MRNLNSPSIQAPFVSFNVALTENCLKNTKTCRDEHRLFATSCTFTDIQSKTRKRSRRVRFADEHGGKLCNVKVIDCSPLRSTICSKVPFRYRSMTDYSVVYNETKLNTQNICLVAYGILATSNIFGAIAVKNIAYDKIVIVRLTLDSWKTSRDIPASFVQQERNGTVDRFFFMTSLDGCELSDVVSSLEFAVCYCVGDETFWDNNSNSNYRFR